MVAKEATAECFPRIYQVEWWISMRFRCFFITSRCMVPLLRLTVVNNSEGRLNFTFACFSSKYFPGFYCCLCGRQIVINTIKHTQWIVVSTKAKRLKLIYSKVVYILYFTEVNKIGLFYIWTVFFFKSFLRSFTPMITIKTVSGDWNILRLIIACHG